MLFPSTAQLYIDITIIPDINNTKYVIFNIIINSLGPDRLYTLYSYVRTIIIGPLFSAFINFSVSGLQ